MSVVLAPRLLEGTRLGGPCVFYDEDIPLDARDDAGFFVPIYMGPVANLTLMQDMPRLEVCQLLTAGFDGALPHLPDGVTLCNAGGVHDASTAELAVGLILASLRGIDDAVRAMPNGRWGHRTRPALADRMVVVIGAGGVGEALRRRLEPFECTVHLVGRTARDRVHAVSALPELLGSADIVVLALPLDPDTAGMVDEGFLAQLRDGALLVNVARGGIVDTDALTAAVAQGRITAALDVTDPEPLPADHVLWRTPGVLITPHLGGNSSAFLPRARRLVERQVAAWRAGDPLAHVVRSPRP